jgi:hypothetical protein
MGTSVLSLPEASREAKAGSFWGDDEAHPPHQAVKVDSPTPSRNWGHAMEVVGLFLHIL